MVKKIVSLMVVTLAVVVAAATVTQKYTNEAPVVRNGTIYLENSNAYKSDFNPGMVMKTSSLLMPVGHTVQSFSVDYGKPVLLQGSFTIKQYIPGGRISIPPPTGYRSTRGAAYAKDEFFPALATRNNSRFRVVFKNGHAIFTTMFTPVQYNPVTSQIQYYPKVTVKVNTMKNTSAPVYKCNSFIRSWLKDMVDNPEVIDNLPDSPRGENDYEYLIITSDGLKTKWGALEDFNKERCLRTKVATVSDITRIPGIRGRDNQETIRNYIKTEYETNNIVFVMLGGDVELVPHRGMHTSFFDYGVNPYEDYQIPADLYYSCLDGTWQKSGSQYYGEYGCDEDVGWEVYAARFAVDSETELNNMINKTIKYIKSPVASSATNVILGGEDLWDAWQWNGSQYVKTGGTCWGADNMEEFIGECSNNGYTTQGWPSGTNYTKLYCKTSNWTGSTMISTVRNDKIAFIDHLGHSNTNYILQLNTSQVSTSNFQNDGSSANFFIVYTQGCYPGAFDNKTPNGSQTQDCIGEKFATISTAAVAFISNTRYGLGADGREGSTGNSPLTDGSSTRYQRFFHSGVSKNYPLEMANGWGKEQNKEWICNSDPHGEPYHGQMKYCAYQVNIIGDPALHVWTKEPQTLNGDYPTPLSGPAFTWETGIACAWVALCDDQGEIITMQMAGDDGKININDQVLADYLVQNPDKNLKVRVKAQNYLLFEGDLPVDFVGIDQIAQHLTLKNSITASQNTLVLQFTLPEAGKTSVTISNAKGAVVYNHNQTVASKGTQILNVNTANLSSGVYYCTFGYQGQKAYSRFMICR